MEASAETALLRARIRHQQRTDRPGAAITHSIDVRIIAATNVSVEQEQVESALLRNGWVQSRAALELGPTPATDGLLDEEFDQLRWVDTVIRR